MQFILFLKNFTLKSHSKKDTSNITNNDLPGRAKYRRNNGFDNNRDDDTLGIVITGIPSAVIPTVLHLNNDLYQ